jgi:hypothetical protein
MYTAVHDVALLKDLSVKAKLSIMATLLASLRRQPGDPSELVSRGVRGRLGGWLMRRRARSKERSCLSLGCQDRIHAMRHLPVNSVC